MNVKPFKHFDRKDKSVFFFSGSGPGDVKALLDAGIYDMLVSYHYIRKNKTYYETEILPLIKEKGGLFMTDSGAFSFFNMEEIYTDDEAYKPKFWIDYLEEYTEWLRQWKDYIYVAANLDLDNIVGRDVVNKWNRKYFEPLEKEGLQIVYVSHKDDKHDKTGLKHLEQYLKRYSYVGVNQSMRDDADKIYALVHKYNKRVHGFAWTSMPTISRYPMFSVDSTTWLGGPKFGATYFYDGKNFTALDSHKKFWRKKQKNLVESVGRNYDDYIGEHRHTLNRVNLEGWKGARHEYLKIANLKLKNKSVLYYAKTKTKK